MEHDIAQNVNARKIGVDIIESSAINMKSRNEIDFLRLLRQCHKIADQRSWRLDKYVDTLSDLLDGLRNHLSRDKLEGYTRNIISLKRMIEAEKLPSAEKRLLACEILAPDRESKVTNILTKHKHHERPVENENDVDDVITQNLLELTNNIRDNMQAANAIIQKDTETLTKVSGGADNVSMKMQRNTDQLVRKGFQCAIWFYLLLVTLSFIIMVVFIRLNPKVIK